MPTGYTHQLMEMNYDVKRWLKEGVIRAMGVCVALRDENGPMTETEIKKALRKDHGRSDSYYVDCIEKAKKNYETIQAQSQEALLNDYWATRKEEQARYDKRLEDFKVEKAAHETALRKLNKLMNEAKAEPYDAVAIGTVEFAIDQIRSTINFDYREIPWKPAILSMEFDEWVKTTKAVILKDIEYYERESKKVEIPLDRAEAYDKFVRFVDKNAKIL